MYSSYNLLTKFSKSLNNHSVVLDLRSDRLAVVARLKAAQVTQVISSVLGEVILISSRNYLQTILSSYYTFGIDALDQGAIQDFQLDLESADSAMGGAIYSNTLEKIIYSTSNGTQPTNVSLPSVLFPLDEGKHFNLSYINNNNGYMRGPVSVNDSFYTSFTRPILKNVPDFQTNNQTFVDNTIGYLTIVSLATNLVSIAKDLNLEDGSRMALVQIAGNYTRSEVKTLTNASYTFVFPSNVCTSCYGYNYSLKPDGPSYMALINGFWGTVLDVELTGYGQAAVGFAPVTSISQVWAVLIFQAHSVMYGPIRTLRDILLASVFAIGFGVCLSTFLLSGWVVKPITRLQAATEQSTNHSSHEQDNSGKFRKFFSFFKLRSKENSDAQLIISNKFSASGSEFRIPEKVITRKYIKDELTELTETFNDMTSELRKQYAILEERVVQRTKEIKSAKVLAETANEAKSLFIANITHELRTPLNGILGMAAVSMEEKNPQNIRDALKVIFKSGELLLRLLTDLLSFSKSQVDNMQLEPKGFSISEVTTQLHAIFDEQSRSSNIRFSIEVVSSCLHNVELMGDINRILQVVMNLVSNSLKFTPANGVVAVTISASEHTLDIAEKVDSVVESSNTDFPLKKDNGEKYRSILLNIVVQDSGPGIAPNLQSRVFEPFVQGDLELSEKRGGVGLGLSICRQLATIMNGEVSLVSELGNGCKFTFKVPLEVIGVHDSIQSVPPASIVSCDVELPSQEQTEMKKPIKRHLDTVQLKSKPESNSFNDLSVLIAEDNRVNQEVLLRMLKLEGLSTVRVAKDGLEAVNAVKEAQSNGSRFDIIFMDIQMPNLDGKQATEVIRKDLNYSGTIIAVSAFTDNSNIDDCLAVGMDHFLAKPLRRPQLHSLLAALETRES